MDANPDIWQSSAGDQRGEAANERSGTGSVAPAQEREPEQVSSSAPQRSGAAETGDVAPATVAPAIEVRPDLEDMTLAGYYLG